MSDPEILYVGGLGRSGSTLLERALSQFTDVCGLGEVVYLWERGVRNDERCGCGEAFSQCPFWVEVGARAFGGWDRVDVDRIAELQQRVDDVRHVPRLLLPGRLGLRNAIRRDELEEYLGYYEALYAAAAEVSGSRVVVDSSKITSLAYVLSFSRRMRMRLVHILRDPRAVSYAWTKVVRRPEIADREAFMPRYSPAYMACLYAGHHVLLEALRSRGVPATRVRYEDFADDPFAELEKVAQFAGLQVPDQLRGELPDSLRLNTVHTVSGNPSRFDTGEVVVRRDEKWRGAMPRRSRVLVTALTAPVMAAYRYPAPIPNLEPALNSDPKGAPLMDLPEPDSWPSVTVIVPTHNRPELVRRALASVVAQDYPGRLETVVVFDRAEPDQTMVSDDLDRPISVTKNDRTPGLAGARNTGIVGADTDLVAFLDDDDHWEVNKLSRQVRAMTAEPGAEFATTAMTIDYEDRSIPRTAQQTRVTHQMLLRSRMAMLHSSSFLADRGALIDGIGLVDETIPKSMAEDWDILLRAAERRPIVHLDEPLVRVQWGPTSYFADQWQTRRDSGLWLLEHHPGLGRDRLAAGLTYGKLAYESAMLGNRGDSVRFARKAFRADWRQPRTVLAMLVNARLLSGQWVVDQLNRRGHGI